ncbi:hypothetical protein SESBI_07186 [Sesbania bispinosa]|nr:hypothetical protein SESBI_07186 [Sesbania bispinosa]
MDEAKVAEAAEGNNDVDNNKTNEDNVSKDGSQEVTSGEDYGPWMLVNKGVRRRQAQNARNQSLPAAKSSENVADKSTMVGSRFSALADNMEVEEEGSLPTGVNTHPLGETPQVQVPQPSRGVPGPKSPKASLKSNAAIRPNMGPDETVCRNPTPVHNSVTLIRRTTRGKSQVEGGPVENPPSSSHQIPSKEVLPVAHPIKIPQANICETEQGVVGGVCNLRPPNPVKPRSLTSGIDGAACASMENLSKNGDSISKEICDSPFPLQEN